MRMGRADARFVYRQRPTIQAFRALVVLPRPQGAGQVVQSRPKLGMIGSERFLEHAKRSPVEPFCSYIISLVLEQESEIVELDTDVGVLRSQDLFSQRKSSPA